MDNNGPDPQKHNDGARKSSDNEDEKKIAPQPPPLMIDENSRVVAVIRNRISPAREGQPLPVLVRTIEPLPNGGVPVRIANDIINGKYDDVQLSPPPVKEEAAASANPVVDPDHGTAAAAAAVVTVKQEPEESMDQLTENVTKNLSFESISSDSESETKGAEVVPPLSRPPRGSPPPPLSGATGASHRLYDFPYPIVRSGRFTNLADMRLVMREDIERALRELESHDESWNGARADECGSMPGWQTRQRRPGNIAKTPPSISDDDDDDDDDDEDEDEKKQRQRLITRTLRLDDLDELTIRTAPRKRIITKTPIVPGGPPLLMRPFADRTRIGTPPIDLRTCRSPLQEPSKDHNHQWVLGTPPPSSLQDHDKKLAGSPRPVDLRTTSRTPPPPPQQQQQQQQQQQRRFFGMNPPRSPGVLRTRINSAITPQRRHSQPSTAAPPLYAGPRRSSVPVRHPNGTGTGAGLADGGWAARHACENEDCRSFWQHLQECGLQLPPGWYVMQHEDARGRPYAYVVQLDVGARDMVPNLARSIMIDQHGRLQYFMYGGTVDASDSSLPQELNDLAALNEIVDVFASMNHEF